MNTVYMFENAILDFESYVHLRKVTIFYSKNSLPTFRYSVLTEMRPPRRRSGQDDYIKKIALSGFTSLPSGLRRDGGGVPSSGYLLLKALSEKLGTFQLTIDRNDKNPHWTKNIWS